MFRAKFLLYFTLVVVLDILTIPTVVMGGSCWGRYDPEKGTCLKFLRLVTSQEQCCSSRGVAYTTRTMTTGGLFRMLVTQPEGIPRCIPCSSVGEDVCSEIECNANRRCVSLNGQPRCVCRPDCSDVEMDAIVCGTNNSNYTDECQLRMAACKAKRNIEVAYPGECQDSCDNVDCLGRRCLQDIKGVPRCLNCTLGCFEHEVRGSVCGRDNNTYESDCHLRLKSCSLGVAIPKRHHGRCEGSTDCSSVRCLEGKVCAMEEEREVPHCSECHLGDCSTQMTTEVCGSDNVTYSNECSLKRAICDSRRFVSRSYYGPCVDRMVTPENYEQAFRKYVCRFGERGPNIPYRFEDGSRLAEHDRGR